MNFNDLQSRLKRIYSTINIKYDENVLENTNIRICNTPELEGFFVNFGKNNDSEMQGKVLSILFNISTLKDNLKTALLSKQKNPNIIEETINTNFYLQLLFDLVNQDKHGYPLTKTNRSKKNPLLANFNQNLQLLSPTSSLSISKKREIKTQGASRITIVCDVYDDKGNIICSIDELINNCMNTFEELIDKNELRIT